MSKAQVLSTLTNALTADSSGNVGIGVPTPQATLDVNGNLRIKTQGYLQFGGSGNNIYGDATANILAFATNGNTERMRIDANGAIGFGVVPKSGLRLNLPAGEVIGFHSGVQISDNAYYSSGWKLIAAGKATNYSTASGEHLWYYTGTGTADSTANWLLGAKLDSNGSFGIGVTPIQSGFKFQVNGEAYINALNTGISFGNGGANTGYGKLWFDNTNNNMVLNSSYASGGIIFTTGGTATRAQIDSNGRLITYWRNGFINSGNEFNFAGNLSSSAIYVNYAGAAVTVTQYHFLNGAGGGAYVGLTASAYNPSSDYRVKTDVQDEAPALAGIMSLRPVNYFKEGVVGREHGLIAHEVQEIFPSLVGGEGKDAVDEDGDIITQTVSYMGLAAILVKAVQELKLDLDETKAELALLKGAA